MKYKYTTRYEYPATVFILVDNPELLSNTLFHDLVKAKHGQPTIVKLFRRDKEKYDVSANVPPPISPNGDYSGWEWQEGIVER